MTTNMYYVYELVDPRTNKPFYIGKGSGNRIDKYRLPRDYGITEYTRRRLEEIALSGNKLEINIIQDSLSESAALKLEKSLIKKHGRMGKDLNGILTNIRSSGGPTSNKKKTKQQYTTIQLTIDTAEIIRKFCLASGRTISGTTDMLWMTFISASVSGASSSYTS